MIQECPFEIKVLNSLFDYLGEILEVVNKFDPTRKLKVEHILDLVIRNIAIVINNADRSESNEKYLVPLAFLVIWELVGLNSKNKK